MRHKLVLKATGEQVKPGDTVTDFRGDTYELVNFKVQQPPSTGRITVKNSAGMQSEFYPHVCNLHILEIENDH